MSEGGPRQAGGAQRPEAAKSGGSALHTVVNPEVLGAPPGFSSGMLAKPGRLLFVAGQIGAGRDQRVVSNQLAAQFERALSNVMAVVYAAGGEPDHLCRLTIQVTNKQDYLSSLTEVGAAYRKHLGHHFPASSLVEVAGLLEPMAQVQIEAVAVIPD